MLWTVAKCTDTVSVPINVDKLSVDGKCIRTHKIIIRQNCLCVNLSFFISCFCNTAVNKGVIFRMVLYVIEQTHFS